MRTAWTCSGWPTSASIASPRASSDARPASSNRCAGSKLTSTANGVLRSPGTDRSRSPSTSAFRNRPSTAIISPSTPFRVPRPEVAAALELGEGDVAVVGAVQQGGDRRGLEDARSAGRRPGRPRPWTGRAGRRSGARRIPLVVPGGHGRSIRIGSAHRGPPPQLRNVLPTRGAIPLREGQHPRTREGRLPLPAARVLGRAGPGGHRLRDGRHREPQAAGAAIPRHGAAHSWRSPRPRQPGEGDGPRPGRRAPHHRHPPRPRPRGRARGLPQAKVHVFAPELEIAQDPPLPEKARYIQKQWAHGPEWVSHEVEGDTWFGFESVKPIPGPRRRRRAGPARRPLEGALGDRGHATADGWMLHCGDAYFFRGEVETPRQVTPGFRAFENITQWKRGPRMHNLERLQELRRDHGSEVRADLLARPRDVRRARGVGDPRRASRRR